MRDFRETVESTWRGKIVFILFFIFSLWWAWIQFVSKDSAQLDFFTTTYGVMAVVGAIGGMLTSKAWGGFKTVMGRAILMFSFGLLAQEVGQLAYSYYIYVIGIDVPYPSLGDIGYFGSMPLYAYGVWLLAKASGVRLSLQSIGKKIQAIVIPLAMLIFSYILFLKNYEIDSTAPLTTFLDFGYPMGEAIYVSLAFLTYLLSRNVLGGMMRSKILFILFALFVQFAADYTFLYQVSREVWSISGINDYMFFFAYFLMAVGLLQFNTIARRLKNSS